MEYIVIYVMHPTLYCFQCTNDDDNEITHSANLNKLIQPIIKNSALKFWTMNCVNMEWISSVFTIKELVAEKNSSVLNRNVFDTIIYECLGFHCIYRQRTPYHKSVVPPTALDR
jgi:hypothetical protein